MRRGGIAAAYGDNGVDVGIGRRTVTVFAEDEQLAVAAARQLRLRGVNSPPRLFPSPIYPRAVLAEIVRVTEARRRLHSVRGIARATGLSASAVRVRLHLARMLGSGALRGVHGPGRSWRSVKHDRQVAFWAQEFGERDARRHFRLSRAQLRRALHRVRGLVGDC